MFGYKQNHKKYGIDRLIELVTIDLFAFDLSGRKKRSQDDFGDYTITEDRMDYEIRSDNDREAILLESQEDDVTTEDVWPDQRRTSNQVG